ncbi:DUF1007 family protein [Rhodobacteraceae bacterium NNCM2]|nr:DUF1007 family protein [Coraliihabitans acroporae]
MNRSTLKQFLAAGLMAAATAFASPAAAHPHIYVDGGVDFVLREGQVLEALEVTWLFDEFETLYTLSSLGISLNDQGGLDEGDRIELVKQLSDWPEDFQGSAHLSVGGEDLALKWPGPPDARLVDGRLEMTFARQLEEPHALAERRVEVGFYEATYFYAFSVTNEPKILGDGAGCSARVIPFNPDTDLIALQTTLFELGREETPGIANVGSLFADRIVLQCA